MLAINGPTFPHVQKPSNLLFSCHNLLVDKPLFWLYNTHMTQTFNQVFKHTYEELACRIQSSSTIKSTVLGQDLKDLSTTQTAGFSTTTQKPENIGTPALTSTWIAMRSAISKTQSSQSWKANMQAIINLSIVMMPVIVMFLALVVEEVFFKWSITSTKRPLSGMTAMVPTMSMSSTTSLAVDQPQPLPMCPWVVLKYTSSAHP